MKNRIIKTLIIIFVLGSISGYLYFLKSTKNNELEIKTKTALAAEQQISGGSWGTACTGSVNAVHDGNVSTGVTCTQFQEINWDFGGTYGSVTKLRIYAQISDVNDTFRGCWYPYYAPGFNCSVYGYADWNLSGAFDGPLTNGWNERSTLSYDWSKMRLVLSPFGGGSINIQEVEVYYTGSAPTPTPPYPYSLRFIKHYSHPYLLPNLNPEYHPDDHRWNLSTL